MPTPTDTDLLRRYVSENDGAAFSALVRKHGPMVLGTCRRVAAHHHDAEDAFQACFVVLAARAAAIRRPTRLGGWLHGVAVRCARKARDARLRAAPAAPLVEPAVLPPAAEPDLKSLLDEALAALSDTYRAAVVLCHLEERSRAEAARELGWSEGTLSGRLHRARALLAEWLAARGVTAAGAALVAVLSARPSAAGVPAALTGAACSSAALVTAGLTEPGVPAVALADQVMRTMTFGKVTLTAVLLFGVAACSFLALGVAAAGPAESARAARRAAPVPAEKPTQVWAEQFTLKHNGPVTAVAFGKTRVATAAGNRGEPVCVWDPATGAATRARPGRAAPDKPVRWMQLLEDDRTLLHEGENDGGTVCRTDLGDDAGKTEGIGLGGLRFVGASRSGETWVALFPARQHVVFLYPKMFDRAGLNLKDVTEIVDADGKAVTHAALSAECNRLATINAGAVLRIYDRATSKETHALPLKNGTVPTVLKLSGDGKRLAVVGEKGFAVLFDAAGGKELCELKGHTGTVHAAAFSPDGGQVATANGRFVRVFDAKTGAPLGEIKAHADDVLAVEFAPDGKRLLTGSKDKTAKIWKLND